MKRDFPAVNRKSPLSGLSLLIVFGALLMLSAGVAGAEEGLHHGERFEMKRDGALILNFLVLLAGILWLLFRFGLPMLKKRSEDLAEGMAQSEMARKLAMEKLAELETKMREFEVQSAKTRKDAVAQGEELKAKIIADAKDVAARIMEKAKEEIDNEATKAQERLRRDAVELAAELADGLLRKNYKESDHRNSVKDFIKDVGARGTAG
jgi:F-type H+-transporting ATPase subunit b